MPYLEMRVQIFSSTFFILVLFSSSDLGIHFPSVSGQCLQDQKLLLLELRNNLTYDSSLSTKLVQWNESTDCCQWSGVKCDNKGRVSSLDLSGESISSGINDASSSLFKLVFLKNLSLAENTLDSIELPTGFGKLTELSCLNLSNSGFSGQIPLDFSNLTRLVVLDLSPRFSASLKLENPDLGRLIHNFPRLRELYLDGVNISAKGYDWCNAISSSLPDLRVLSMSGSYLSGPFDSSLLKLRSLSTIRLDSNAYSSPFPEFFADFPNLQDIIMSSSDLSGVVPAKLFQIKSLETIDLSGNTDLQGSLPEFPSPRMLSKVDLTGCNFSGPIPSSIKNLNQLVSLELSENRFVGSVPSFAFLKNLEAINLRANRLTGRISDTLWEGLENLKFLDLSENSLEGEIPVSLFALPSLTFLYLYNNSFSGSIRDSSNISSSALGDLDLSVNNIEGPIPRFFFELQNLWSLSLSFNKFNGSVDLTDFQKLTDLGSLDLSYNNLSVRVNEKVSMSSLFPRLGSLMLASCKLENFPLLKNQTPLMTLDLSDNQLRGEIPNWIWEVGNGFLRYLNLSHNQFTHLQEPYVFSSQHYLDLHSNMLGGQVPIPPPSAALVDFSSNNFSSSLPPDIGNNLKLAFLFSIANNRITGTIPRSFCNTTRLQILDLSNNTMNGIIPSCLLEKTLEVLNLRRNNLSGDIPDTFPIGCGLETLDLSLNGLQGKLPKSLARCTDIEVLSLGNNVLNDVFPCWLKNLSKLRVLVLSFNKFHGNLDCLQDIKTWTNLQIIGIASNNFDGVLPENLFQNLKTLMVGEDSRQSQLDHLHFEILTVYRTYYQDSVTVTFKGQNHDLVKILTIFTSIDFSNNHFKGTIPRTVGELKSLHVLDFSHNDLSGHIPSSIGNLQQLESLDLSFNHLGGEIPSQLASPRFLSFLNLSYNQLVGRIPQGRQMQTFTESSFVGNDGLCGFPLNKNCSYFRVSPFPESRSDDEQKNSDPGIYVSVALGFLVGLGAIFGPILFSKRWRRRHNKIVNKLILLVLREQKDQLEKEDW